MADNTLDIQQSVGDVGGDFTKSITIEAPETIVSGGDIAATIEFIEKIYNYLPELVFATLYGLAVYAAVLWIRRLIKK
jgi:hypothetical protein